MTEQTELRLSYSLPDEVLRGNSRAHWAVRHPFEQKMKTDATVEGLSAGGACMWERARITFLFHHWKEIDTDNFVKGMKYYIDGLKAAGVFPDDKSKYLKHGEHDSVMCKKGDEGVDILVEKLA